MEKLTQRQKHVFDAIIDGKTNLSEIGKLIGNGVSRQAIRQRVLQMVSKGYLRQENGIFLPTGNGLDKIIKDDGKTKHSYYDKKTNWEKTLRPDGLSQEA